MARRCAVTCSRFAAPGSGDGRAPMRAKATPRHDCSIDDERNAKRVHMVLSYRFHSCRPAVGDSVSLDQNLHTRMLRH
jgi:hypothetical protein